MDRPPDRPGDGLLWNARPGARRAVAALSAGQLVSASGAQMAWLALPWFVLTTTGSPARSSAVFAAEMLPIALFGVPSGAAVARLGARRTLLLCDAIRTPLIVAVPVLNSLGLLSFPLILGLVFLIGLCFAPYYGAQRVAVVELVGTDERRVGVSNAFVQGAARLPVLVGPAAGGLLVTLIGPLAVLYVSAVAFLVAFALVSANVPAGLASGGPTRPAAPILGGLRALFHNRLLRVFAGSGVCTEAAFQALQVALPVLVFVRHGEDPRLAGILLGAWGGGALVGCLAAAAAVLHIPAWQLVAWGALVQSLPLWALPFDVPVAALLVALALSGLANGISVAPKTTVLTLGVDETVRAHTMTAYLTLLTVAGVGGVLAAGLAMHAHGPAPVLAALAGLGTAGGVALFVACWHAHPVHQVRQVHHEEDR